jgi:hypothetical protein
VPCKGYGEVPCVPYCHCHPQTPHLQGGEVGDAEWVVLASVHNHQLPAAGGGAHLHAPTLHQANGRKRWGWEGGCMQLLW